MPNSKQIVYLSQAQYQELITNGTITVNGVTVTYNENDIYVTPQAEPVTDVRVNGTSITSNGLVEIPITNDTPQGLVPWNRLTGVGLYKDNYGWVRVNNANLAAAKSGNSSVTFVSTAGQHESTFYGLAKVAGHDEKDSTESVGTYTPEAQGAIQSMLGVSDIIAAKENTLAASKLYKVGDIFTAKGKLYKATAAIAQDSAIILPGEANANCEEVTVAALVDGKADKNGTVLTSTLSRGRKAGTVIGGASFAFGYNVEASGGEAFATGTNTVASGNNALAAGGGTVASGLDSEAHGWRTIANHRSQTVIGECNVEDPSTADSENRGTYVEIVGNGTAVNARSNARTLDWNGNEVLAGTITANGVNLNDEINDKLDKPSTAGTAGQVLTSDGQGGQSWEMPDVTDVQVNGMSVVSNGVANVPIASATQLGLAKGYNQRGIGINTTTGEIMLQGATAQQCKTRVGSTGYQPITVFCQDAAAFYGLAGAAGDTTMTSSSNAVGTYTDSAKASIKAMLGIQDGSTGTVDVSGTTPTIMAIENTRYVCGEVSTLSFTPAASGICIVRFTSGSSVTVLTIPSTVKFPEWFDPTSLETDTIYEICITDGVYGAVMSWAL